jgi:hypothetical protein
VPVFLAAERPFALEDVHIEPSLPSSHQSPHQAAAVLIRGKYPQQQKAEAGGEIDAMRAKMAQYERLQEQRAARQREIQALIDAMQGKGRQPSVREQVA